MLHLACLLMLASPGPAGAAAGPPSPAPQGFKIDLAPLKAPLEKAANQLERGVFLFHSGGTLRKAGQKKRTAGAWGAGRSRFGECGNANLGLAAAAGAAAAPALGHAADEG